MFKFYLITGEENQKGKNGGGEKYQTWWNFIHLWIKKDRIQQVVISGGLNHLPYLLSISVSLAVIKDFSTNYMTALGLNQAYTSLKLRNKYNIVLIYLFRSITGNILQL